MPKTPTARPRKRLGELLVDGGLITAAQLEQALQAQKTSGTRLGTQLLIAGWVSEEQLADFLSQQLGLPCLHRLADVDPAAAALLSAEVAVQHCVLGVALQQGKLSVAMADPSDSQAVAALQRAVGRPLQVMVAPELVVSYGVRKFYAPEAVYEPDPGQVRPQFARETIRATTDLLG